MDSGWLSEKTVEKCEQSWKTLQYLRSHYYQQNTYSTARMNFVFAQVVFWLELVVSEENSTKAKTTVCK